MRGGKRAVIAAVLLASARAAAEPRVEVPPLPILAHVTSNSSLWTDTNPDVEWRLPPGWFADEDTWARMDAEHRRLEDAEHRLSAENRVLRQHLDGWQPGWYVVGAAVLVGAAAGVYIGYKL